MSAVSFQHVSFSYDGKKQALKDVSLTIDQGSFTCILGGNGSGKSTLAKLINALLLPDEGSVEVLGALSSNPQNLFFIRSNAGMVFQNPDDQIVASVVEDDVAFGPENMGVPEDELPARVQTALQQVGMAGFAQRETHALSGGQKQRVAFAGVLAMQPQILILDEAGAMLDPRGQRELFKVCRELNQKGYTIIFITHSMDEAALADRVIIMQDGSIAEDGTPQHVLRNVQHVQQLKLDVPFAAKMSTLLQERGLDISFCITKNELVQALRTLEVDERTILEAPYIKGASLTAGISDMPATTITFEASNEEGSSKHEANNATASDEPLLSFRNIWFTYTSKRALKEYEKAQQRERDNDHVAEEHWGNKPDEFWALQSIHLDVHAGDFLGIAGHTGSGKSTLLQLANGILQPTEGRVLLLGKDLSNKKEAREAHQHVGLVFQYPERQLFAATVFDDVAFGPRNLGLSDDEVTARVMDALNVMQLDAERIKDRSPFVLSGGQQRRVAIAGVLAMDPSVLILDEPAAGLDPQAHDDLLTLIASLHSQQGKTIVMVSHDMDDLAYHCNRIIVLNQGKLYAQGVPTEIFERSDALARIGLTIPRTLQLEKDLGLGQSEGAIDPWMIEHPIPTVDELADHLATRLLGRSVGE